MVSQKKQAAGAKAGWVTAGALALALVLVCILAFLPKTKESQGAMGEVESSPAASMVTVEPTAAASSSAFMQRRDVVFPKVEGIDRSQVEGVARAAVTSLATWDARDDRGYGEAVARTAALFDEDLVARVSAQAGEPVAWDEQVVEREAFSSPHVMDYDIFSDYTNEVQEFSGVSRDGRELRFMQFAVRWDWLGRDGSSWADESTIRVYDLVMVKDAAGWSVASYAWRDEVQ